MHPNCYLSINCSISAKDMEAPDCMNTCLKKLVITDLLQRGKKISSHITKSANMSGLLTHYVKCNRTLLNSEADMRIYVRSGDVRGHNHQYFTSLIHYLTKLLENCHTNYLPFFYKFVPTNAQPFRQIITTGFKKFILDEEHNIRRNRKTAPGPKNSLSLLRMSVQLGAAFTIIKQYKNITSIAHLRYDKNI